MFRAIRGVADDHKNSNSEAPTLSSKGITMSDNRSISGTVRTTSADNAAAVAYRMALDIWRETNSKPKVDDIAFLELVRKCALALKGGVHEVN